MKMKTPQIIPFLLPILPVSLLCACINSATNPGMPSDDATMTASDGGSDAVAADPFAEVDRIATANAPAVGAFGLAIYGSDDRLLFQKMYGDFAPDRRVAVASSSKWISGLTLFRLVTDGKLSLDSTTGTVLGWSGPNAAITLRHLLSFTSGLPPDHTCTLNTAIKLSDCVAQIEKLTLTAAPGARFDYGSTHLAVAGRMAEVVTGKAWNDIFTEQLRTPLGLSSAVTYYTLPNQQSGTQNPLVAGGLVINMNEYAPLLGLIFRRGILGGQRLIRDDLFTEQARAPYPSAVIGQSPMQNAGYPFLYGLTAWLECSTPAAGCAIISSPGAYGFTPWVDRDAGYYAIIGTLNTTSSGKVVKASIDAAQALKPAIRAALGK
jgi:D-alanyl-D-alanine-carboxypeptidase/D-alanyl-D-alanine-endopeptidase